MITPKSKPLNSTGLNIYLNIKKVQHREGNDYFQVSNDKSKFELFDEIKKTKNSDTISLNPTYIFEQNPMENSVIFENVCRNSVSDFLKGQRQLYITYGLTKTGKKTFMFGEENSLSNLNNRGIIYRFIEKLLLSTNKKSIQNSNKNVNNKISNQKLNDYNNTLTANFKADTIHNKNTTSIESSEQNYSVSYSFYTNFQSKVLDLCKIKSSDIETISETDLLKQYESIKHNKDYENQLNKIEIYDLDDFIKNINQILWMFYRLEPFDNKLYSRSSFILNIHLFDNKGNKISNVCFCSMAAAESKSINQVFNLKKIKHSINVNTDIIALINILREINKKDISKLKDIFNKNDSFLITCLKTNFLFPTQTKIIGCIFPAPYNHSNVKDTIMVLKRLSLKNADVSEFDQEPEEENKDDIIYNLNNKIKNQEKSIDKLKENIFDLKKKIDESEGEYKEKLEVIKKALGFEGDINKLLLNNDYLPEAMYARKIRDSFSHNVVLGCTIKDLEANIFNLKKEKEKVLIEKGVLENDMAMVNMYAKIKENNISEENRLKLLLEYNKDKDELKKQNEQLIKKNESLRNEIELRNSQFKQLPDILKDNIIDKKNLGNLRDELQQYYQRELKAELKILKDQSTKEIKLEKAKLQTTIDSQNEIINDYKSKNIKVEYNMELKLKKVYAELVNLHGILSNTVKEYKTTFDLKKVNLTNIPSGQLLQIKNTCDTKIDDLCFQVNKYSYPNLFEALNDKSLNLHSNHYHYVNKNTNSTKEGGNHKNSTNVYNSSNKKHSSSGLHNNYNTISNFNQNNNKPISVTNVPTLAEEYCQEADEILGEKIYYDEDLENLDKALLKTIVLELQTKTERLREIISLMSNSNKGGQLKRYGEKTNSEIENLYHEIEHLKYKLKTQVALTNKYKMILESQERMISNYKNEQYYKLEKNKLDIRPLTPVYSNINSNENKIKGNNSNGFTSHSRIASANKTSRPYSTTLNSKIGLLINNIDSDFSSSKLNKNTNYNTNQTLNTNGNYNTNINTQCVLPTNTNIATQPQISTTMNSRINTAKTTKDQALQKLRPNTGMMRPNTGMNKSNGETKKVF